LKFDEAEEIVLREYLAACTNRQHLTSMLEEKHVKMIFQFEANRAEKELIELLLTV
jgi:hypothetical protein